jgi:tetratricopeptide (TPR) repeat protein
VARRTSSLTYRDIAGVSKALRDGILLHNQGRLSEAEQRYQRVLAANGRHFDALYRLGLIRLHQARFGNAADLFRHALKADRNSVEALHHLAVALAGLERFDEAIKLYEKTLALKPDHPEAHNNLAHSQQLLGRNDEALAHYEKALAIKPAYVEARNNFGALLQTLGRLSEAVPQYQAAIAARPDFTTAHKNLGNVLDALNRHEEAAIHFERALALHADDTEALIGLGNTFLKLERPDAAAAQFAKVRARNPASAEALNGLGSAAHMLGRTEEAINHYDMALTIRPNDSETHRNLGEAYLALGQLEKAHAAMETALALASRKAGYYWNLANSKRFTENDPHLAALEALNEQSGSLTEGEQIDLHFALGKAHSDLGAHVRSFHHLLSGNRLMRQCLSYNEAKVLGQFEEMRQSFTPSLMEKMQGSGDPSQAPVFIIGMPRSGTTLIEQIIASHPKVYGGGELREMAYLAERFRGSCGIELSEDVLASSGGRLRRLGSDYVQAVRRLAPEAERITDKMPGNFLLAGLIHLALPNARIIHACRDVRDTAFSCFSLLFARGQPYSYDLSELGRYCRSYQKLMAHWHEVIPGVILDVHYEAVVEDLEQQARRVIAHCGLAWDSACLDFYRTQRSVRTASAAQVRQPIYRSSVGRWRLHERALQPLLEALDA